MKLYSKNSALEHTQCAAAAFPPVALTFVQAVAEQRSGSKCMRFVKSVCSVHGLNNATLGRGHARTKIYCSECLKIHSVEKTRASKLASGKLLRSLQATLDRRHAKGKGAKVIVGQRLSLDEVELTCEVHGTWVDHPRRVRDNMSFTCPKCAKLEWGAERYDKGYERFCEDWKNRDNRFVKILPGEEYAGSYVRLKAHCMKHDLPVSVLPNGFGPSVNVCPKCAQNTREASREALGLFWTLDEVNTRLRENGSSLKCLEWNGTTKRDTMLLRCTEHDDHEDFYAGSNYLYRQGARCPRCTKQISKAHASLFAYVKSLCPDAVLEARYSSMGLPPELAGKRRADIYVPSQRKTLELDGAYWHADVNASATKHAKRHADLASVGVRLFALTDIDWSERTDVFKQAIANYLNVSGTVLYARRLTLVKNPPHDAVKAFCKNHHLQGAPRSVKHAVALADGSRVVAVMVLSTLSSVRGVSDASTLELSRYAVRAGYRIVGGAERLFKALLQECTATRVVSYSHNKWFTGRVYEKLGFTLTSRLKPDYRTYWKGDYGVRGLKSKQFSKRENLARVLGSDFNPNESEFENLRRVGVAKLYDYGKLKWEFQLK